MYEYVNVCVDVGVCVRARLCVRVCVCVFARARVRACVRASKRVCMGCILPYILIFDNIPYLVLHVKQLKHMVLQPKISVFLQCSVRSSPSLSIITVYIGGANCHGH